MGPPALQTVKGRSKELDFSPRFPLALGRDQHAKACRWGLATPTYLHTVCLLSSYKGKVE